MVAEELFSRMSALGDPVRSRVLLVLERRELTVSELCVVFQLPQSTMSRHLKVLTDEGWLIWRAEGTSRRYSMPTSGLDGSARKLWRLVREQVAGMVAAEQDSRRVMSVLARRKTASQEFYSTAAGEWDRMRRELFGDRADLLGLLGLLDGEWSVGDLGCGTGQVTESLAPFVGRVIAVDDSPAMLAAARRRLGGVEGVEVRSGELEALPVDDGELDAAVLFLALHHVADPPAVLRETGRVLRRGGKALVVDLSPHDREEYRQRMGHVWLGFSAGQLEEWCAEANLVEFRYLPLPTDAAATGPALFAASGRKG